MLQQLIDVFVNNPEYAYLLIFSVLLACGFGVPIPEDITLVAAGVMASKDIISFNGAFVVSMAGVLVGDGTIFLSGRYFGPRVKQFRLFRQLIAPETEEKILGWYNRHGEKVIFFARFAPGLRMPLFLTAGIFRVSTFKFFALDGFAAIISVPVWIWAGEFFGDNLDLLEQKVRTMQHGVLIGLSGLLVLVVGYFVVKKKIMRKNPPNTEDNG